MENIIILRPLNHSDLNVLENIIRRTWKYDTFTSPESARRLAKVYLASCLIRHTWSQAAEVNGTVAGIILAKNHTKRSCSLKYYLRWFTGLCQLLSRKEGRELLHFFQHISHIDARLFRQANRQYDGEVALFVLDEEYRGLGLGNQLFHSMLNYMKQEQLNTFFLYTDSSCNFGFYEHQGMTRRQMYRCTLDMKGKNAEMEFFLYDASPDKL